MKASLFGHGSVIKDDPAAADRIPDLSVQFHAGKRRVFGFGLVIARNERFIGMEDHEVGGSACCDRAVREAVCRLTICMGSVHSIVTGRARSIGGRIAAGRMRSIGG